MNPRICILDYGCGNLASLFYAFRRLGLNVSISSTNQDIRDSTHLVLPGTGAFDTALTRLRSAEYYDELTSILCSNSKPVLAICVGAQILTRCSTEGVQSGLGIIDAQCISFKSQPPYPSLNMGWSEVSINDSFNHLVQSLPLQPRFYFIHGYHFDNVPDSIVLYRSGYPDNTKREFPAAILQRNLLATQFHPERSHSSGQSILRFFSHLQ